MMHAMNFEEFFKQATGYDPLPYQKRWATEEAIPQRVSVPTGLGKTAGAVCSWIWRRRHAENSIRERTPRRLVYCLPMRVLVEQTHRECIRFLDNLNLLGGKILADGRYDPWAGDTGDVNKIRVFSLMGEALDRDWDVYPEADTILVGTQDQLLSRALNRGYGMSRFRWPVHFALLHNDAWWVLDEIQLMGDGLATSLQLAAFREHFQSEAPHACTWMSATLDPNWLQTPDFQVKQHAPLELALENSDQNHPVIADRIRATKKLKQADFTVQDGPKPVADLAWNNTSAGTRTLVVVNTVKRAVEVFDELLKKAKNKGPRVILLHSRFRQEDRKRSLNLLLGEIPEEGLIAVCTQVVEAGVDVSARVLITDVAPAASLIQRFGRCNRRGENPNAIIYWIPQNLQKGVFAPYQEEEVQKAQETLRDMTSAAATDLEPLHDCMDFSFFYVLRRKDLLELFDTTPDLTGADLDVSRYVRSIKETDVHVFWRDVDPEISELRDEPQPLQDELCAVPIAELKEGKRAMWRFDHLENLWRRVDHLVPGMQILLSCRQGGYDPQRGWSPGVKTCLPVIHTKTATEAYAQDPKSETGTYETLEYHTENVVRQTEELCKIFNIAPDTAAELQLAARYHDAGKSHPVFQKALPNPPGAGIWAKSAGKMAPYERTGFRHELASALLMWQMKLSPLATYLVAAHHGKVRLSLRSLPAEISEIQSGERLARGIREGDVLPSLQLGNGISTPETRLSLECMELGESLDGRPSWLAMSLELLEQFGPFRLAFLEALLRVADWRVS